MSLEFNYDVTQKHLVVTSSDWWEQRRYIRESGIYRRIGTFTVEGTHRYRVTVWAKRGVSHAQAVDAMRRYIQTDFGNGTMATYEFFIPQELSSTSFIAFAGPVHIT